MNAHRLFSSTIFFFLFALLQLPLAAQQSSCPNADFELNSFAGWSGTTGTCCPINSTIPGIVPGRHTIMTGPGTDPNTNNQLTLVAPGGDYSVRLGNDNIGYEAEQLRYSFLVTPQTQLFIYRYAVVLQDPGHDSIDQPRFEIRVFDQNGAMDSTCGFYSVVASAGIPGFQTILDPNDTTNTVLWKDWTSVGIDLSSKLGSIITIEFSTGDCNLGGHYGYAYIDCMCFQFNVSADFCPGNFTAILTAPSGFASYAWNTGATTQSINIINPVVGDTFDVVLTSVTGCQVVLHSIIKETYVNGAFNTMDSCFNASWFKDSSFTLTGSPVNNWLWNFGDGTFSSLQNPTHTFPWPGTFNVSLIVNNNGGCRDTVIQPVTIKPPPYPLFTANTVCPYQPMLFNDSSYSLNGNIVSWEWNFGDGSIINTSQNPSHIYNLPGGYYVSLTVADNFGCSSVTGHQVNTIASPVAAFSVPEGCPGVPLNFLNNSSSTTANALWNFGDGTSTVNGNSVTHAFATGGNYNVTLYVTSSAGCSDTIVHPIFLKQSPQANFTATGNCVGQPTLFTSSTPNIPSAITGWSWDFGDGSPIDFSQQPSHIYTIDSLVTISLAVVNADGCKDTTRKVIFVQPVPRAAFSVNDVLCAGSPVQISDSSFSPTGITQYHWYFGDGNSASGIMNPTHTYILPGSYYISLVTLAGNGCVDSLAKPVNIRWIPKVDFTFPVVCEASPMHFTDHSLLFNGLIQQWNWNFGDGTTDTVMNPVHIYNSGGLQQVHLEVTGNNGCKNDTVLEAFVNPVPEAQFTVGNICKLSPVNFNDQSTIATGTIKTWYWTFGDGSLPSNIQFPQHTYSEDTTYEVSLVALSDSGCIDTTSKTVTVHALPEIVFTADSVCLGLPTSLTNISSVQLDSIQRFNWDFGDGVTSNLKSPQHIYNNAGFQTIHLTAVTNLGCVDSATRVTKVYHLPVPDFIADIRSGCEDLPVLFTDQSVSQDGIIEHWNWDFGDGGSDSIKNPDYIYEENGSFDVQLTVTTDLNCSSSKIEPAYIVVHPLPKAGFYTSPDKPDLIFPTVTFHDQSTGASQWYYTLGDGSTSTVSDPLHLYQTIGLYQIMQAVVSPFGCRDTAFGEVFVNDVYTLYIPNSFTPDNDGKNDVFYVYGTGIVDYYMKIFNRWGQPVFESAAMNDGWNGVTNSMNAKEDVYFYLVQVTDVFNKKHELNGRVTVVH